MSLSVLCPEEMEKFTHYPVMEKEIIELLEIANKKIIVDCTVGLGGHAHKFLEVAPNAFLVGIDKDGESLTVAERRLESFRGRFALIKDDFSHLDSLLDNFSFNPFYLLGEDTKGRDVFFFDLGLSTYQLTNARRGFSFLKTGPLDMRMDEDSFLSAYDFVNNLSEVELGKLFRKFGEERYAARIARFIIEERRKEPIYTTTQLTQLILRAVPSVSRSWRIHPATRIFQALRIAVNRELEVLEAGLKKAVSLLTRGGRLGIISFHSLEDRIAKHTFRHFSSQGILKIITKKPVVPSQRELEENVSSRSAKLRVAEKI